MRSNYLPKFVQQLPKNLYRYEVLVLHRIIIPTYTLFVFCILQSCKWEWLYIKLLYKECWKWLILFYTKIQGQYVIYHQDSQDRKCIKKVCPVLTNKKCPGQLCQSLVHHAAFYFLSQVHNTLNFRLKSLHLICKFCIFIIKR